MTQMSEFIFCSMFHALGNGTVEQNQFRGTKHGTEIGTSFQKTMFSNEITLFSMEHRGEQPWNKRLKSCSTISFSLEQNGTRFLDKTEEKRCVKQPH
jgi:hypothetical protein